MCYHMRGSRGGAWKITLENHKGIGFLMYSGNDTLENSMHSMLGQNWAANETPLKWHFAGGPMVACFKLHTAFS